jgi:hypothetical protein
VNERNPLRSHELSELSVARSSAERVLSRKWITEDVCDFLMGSNKDAQGQSAERKKNREK